MAHLEYILVGGDFMLEVINSAICGVLLPIALGLVGVFFMIKLRFFFIIHPIRTIRMVISGRGGFR